MTVLGSIVNYVVVDAAEARGILNAREDAHFIRLADRVVVWTTEPFTASDSRGAPGVVARQREAEGQLYLIVQVGQAFEIDNPATRIVVHKGRYLIAELTFTELDRLAGQAELCWSVRPVPLDDILLDVRAPVAAAVVPWVQTLVASVSQSTYSTYLTSMTAFATRHSLSPQFTDSATLARDELRTLGYAADLRPISVGAGSSFNVVAERTGAGTTGRELVIVVAHLDSINIPGGPSAPAPGADDNASGSAGALEIARVLAMHPIRHDLRVILFGGEEQGLLGSTQYVAALAAAERARIRAVINMDMIATVNTPTLTVLLEGAGVSQTLITALADAAATYTSLTVQTSLNPFASDHVPFINVSIPAVLTIEGADSANTNVHTANDTLTHIDYRLALEIVRMNVATVATMLDVAETALTGEGMAGAYGLLLTNEPTITGPLEPLLD